MALGAAIACPDRKVVHLQADGSGMYTVQALWSMAREKADVIIIVLKNDAYAILGLEMARVRERETNAKMKSMLDLDNPTLDWVKSRRVSACPQPGRERPRVPQRFEAALGAKGPQLIECQISTPKEWFELEEYIHKKTADLFSGNVGQTGLADGETFALRQLTLAK